MSRRISYFFLSSHVNHLMTYQLYHVPLGRSCVKSDNCPESALAGSDDPTQTF